MVMEVEILEDNSNKKRERYKLKVVKVLQKNGYYRPCEPGDIFTCEKQRGVCCSGVWHLEVTK